MKRARMPRERGIKPKAPTLFVEPVQTAMPAPRKVFRIEQMAAARSADRVADAQLPSRHTELMTELAALRAMIAAAAAETLLADRSSSYSLFRVNDDS